MNFPKPPPEIAALDAADPLAALRDHFELPAELIYLDGNSLGALPKATAARIHSAITSEWGTKLIGAWNSAGWIDLPQRVGNMIAPLIGAGPGEVVAVDNTSLNLYKVLAAALALSKARDPRRRIVLSEQDNFPTDLYIAESLCAQHGMQLVLCGAADLTAQIALHGATLAVLTLTHVNYKTGRVFDMQGVTDAAHAAGALCVWDLAHSAGALPVDLHAANADFAIGCGYKYLNGGPGAPAFVWVHPRHVNEVAQPLAGWLGHAAPFEFNTGYVPAEGVTRYISGTPPIVSLCALECGLQTHAQATAAGGMLALRKKSLELTGLFIQQVQSRCPQLELITPHKESERGSQASFTHPTHGYAIMQALIERGVVGDFRAPNILRFGFTPLYTRYADAWQAACVLEDILCSKVYEQERFAQRGKVT